MQVITPIKTKQYQSYFVHIIMHQYFTIWHKLQQSSCSRCHGYFSGVNFSDVNKATAPKAKAKTLTHKTKAMATHLKAKAKTNSIIGLQDQKCQDQKYTQL